MTISHPNGRSPLRFDGFRRGATPASRPECELERHLLVTVGFGTTRALRGETGQSEPLAGEQRCADMVVAVPGVSSSFSAANPGLAPWSDLRADSAYSSCA
jgi:hypothetical protein